MKKIIALLFVVLLVGCDLTTSSDPTTELTQTSNTTTVTTYPEREYSEFDDLKITDKDSQLSQIEETYYVYYYGVNCLTCINIKNEVLSKIELLQNDKVYLVQVSSSQDIHDDIAVQYTPTLVEITNGAVVEMYVGAQRILEVLDQLT